MSESAKPILVNATRDLAAFSAGLEFEAIPGDVIEHAKACVLDSLGCGLYGSTTEWLQKMLEMVREEGGREVATVFGAKARVNPAQAALLNGTACHAFELDDIHKLAGVHAGSLNIPVAMALGQYQGRFSGRDFLTAVVAGYEVACRVGAGAQPGLFFRGFHPQGTIGTIAAGAAGARALNLNADQTQHALGIAGSQAAGLMAAQEGAMVKRLHSGRAAQSGVYAALLAKRGFTGILDVVEAGYGGFISTLSGEPHPELITRGLGTIWETRNIGFKPYSTVASIHAALSALKDIMAENGANALQVARVWVSMSRSTYMHCAWEYKAQGVTAAQMNLFFALAAIAVDGEAFIEQFTESRLRDPRLLAFIPKIEASVDAEIEALGRPGRHSIRIRVQFTDGKTDERYAEHRPGSPENPLTAAELQGKFKALAKHVIDAEAIAKVIDVVQRLDVLEDIEEMAQLLVGSIPASVTPA